MRLENKIGIVTAAGSGMGRAGAVRFAKEGAAVAVVDLNADAAGAVVKTITDAGGKAIALSGDLTDDAFARNIVRETTRAFGALDFVWNHVGHPGPAAIEGLDWKDYDLAMDLNVRTVLVTTSALPGIAREGRRSAAVHRLDIGLTGSQFSQVYRGFGIVGLVHGLSKRYRGEKIRVNAVCPGPSDTPMLRVFVARPDSQLPPRGNARSLVRETRWPVPDGQARTTGNRQRGAVPDLRRGILHHRRRLAGGWRRHGLTIATPPHSDGSAAPRRKYAVKRGRTALHRRRMSDTDEAKAAARAWVKREQRAGLRPARPVIVLGWLGTVLAIVQAFCAADVLTGVAVALSLGEFAVSGLLRACLGYGAGPGRVRRRSGRAAPT